MDTDEPAPPPPTLPLPLHPPSIPPPILTGYEPQVAVGYIAPATVPAGYIAPIAAAFQDPSSAYQDMTTGFQDTGYANDPAFYNLEDFAATGGDGAYEGCSNEHRHGQSQHRGGGVGDRREKEPSPSVMIRGLKPTTDADMITDTLKAFGPVVAVRLIRNKQTGEPRGFAFVDFQGIEDAMNLMAYQNKSIFIDGRTVQLEYSTSPAPAATHGGNSGSGSGGGGGNGLFKDWICPQCNATNFARRTSCYLCNVPKPANPTLAPQPEDSPSSSLIVKGLSATSTDESIRSALSAFSQVKDVRLVRDKNSGLSRCFAFVEFHTVDEATYVLGAAVNSFIDGSPIRLSYARSMDAPSGHRHNNPHSTAASEQAAWAAAYNQPTYSGITNNSNTNNNNQQTNAQSQPGGEGFTYDAASGLYYNASTGYYFEEQTKRYMYFDESSRQYMCYDQVSNSYLPYTPNPSPAPNPSAISSTTESSENPVTDTPPSTPVAPKPKPTISAPSTVVKSAEPVIAPRVAIPFAHTIADKHPIPPPNVTTTVATPTGPIKMTLKETKPKKTLNANVPGIFAKKKISQEVARWNQKGKELDEEPAPSPVTSSANTTPVQPKNIPPPQKHTPAPHTPTNHTPANPPHPPHTPVPPAESAASVSTPDLEPPKAICLLCKRQFKTMEQLHKHETLSELHKTNLELAKQKQLLAKETDHPPEETHQKRSREDSNSSLWGDIDRNSDWGGNKNRKTDPGGGALNSTNLGYQMMRNAGWQGGGLGKTGDGMIAPIEVTMRAERSGLGADDDERYAVSPNDSYKQATRKKALSRFEAITNINVAEVNANHPFLKKHS
eukprot:Phypoly_transcript_02560.p1 GENE.Phypoly_transcript_02560~~Phypoly_transcript_02560.p1  ORF type:complete len:907 (+),score=178.91 Phypoly_transcript_02560:219-2723(+)